MQQSHGLFATTKLVVSFDVVWCSILLAICQFLNLNTSVLHICCTISCLRVPFAGTVEMFL